MTRLKPYCKSSGEPQSIADVYHLQAVGTMSTGKPVVGGAYYYIPGLPVTPSAWTQLASDWWNNVNAKWAVWAETGTTIFYVRVTDCLVPRQHALSWTLPTPQTGNDARQSAVTTLAAFIEYSSFATRKGGPSGWRAGPLVDDAYVQNELQLVEEAALLDFGNALLAYNGGSLGASLVSPDYCHGTHRAVDSITVNPLVASVENRKKK